MTMPPAGAAAGPRPPTRDSVWAQVAGPWDVLVVGGGITGAGVFRGAVRAGLRTLLVEQHDFAWGASGRSSSLVHGGLRYLFHGQWALTRDAVRGREELLAAQPGLVTPIGYLAPDYGRGRTNLAWRVAMHGALRLYDRFAGQRRARYYGAAAFQLLAPGIAAPGLRGGFGWGDAQTDDARLVYRVIQDGLAGGGAALNYVQADTLLRHAGRVVGAGVRDREQARSGEVRAAIVVNATGAWADVLRGPAGTPERMRPLRGSHLIFPGWRVPVAQAIAAYHPADGRPISVVPWEGSTRVGTTDLDHDQPLDAEPRISPAELDYLLVAVNAIFPDLALDGPDVVATYAGVRPVISAGQADPSAESRDYAVWEEPGLVTVTGGKLTTFPQAARETMTLVRRRLAEQGHDAAAAPGPARPGARARQAPAPRLPDRLVSRYGDQAAAVAAAAHAGELEPIPGTLALWAEIRWAARAEMVHHLDDLLLRRTRLGVLLPRGGAAIWPAVQAICRQELGWDDARWAAEADSYRARWRACYSGPAHDTISDGPPERTPGGARPGVAE
ncbi:MAG TPA: glycerol-3-phosphate dehydrogenase/oxidase [Chloroflexia bacterium]|nr:glycerol-3-phosphate dehydrogenase/oxidase [Chloroflexia bacterium]